MPGAMPRTDPSARSVLPQQGSSMRCKRGTLSHNGLRSKSRIESSPAEAFRPSLESVFRSFPPTPSIRMCANDFRDHWILDASATMFGTTAG